MRIIVLGHILAIGIGLSLGLIGGGGSVLAVPILVYVMGVGSREAIAMSLFIVGCVSLLGVIPYARRGHVSWRIVAEFTPAAMVGAYLGTQLVSSSEFQDTDISNREKKRFTHEQESAQEESHPIGFAGFVSSSMKSSSAVQLSNHR